MFHIVHITNTDVKFDSRVRKEIVALNEHDDCCVSVIGVADDQSSGRDLIDGVNYYKMPLFSRLLRGFPRPFRYFFEIIEFTIRAFIRVKASRQKISVVHCHDTFSLPAGWMLKSIIGCNLVYDAHELESNKNGQSSILSKVTLAIERFCWSKIDLLISVSDSIIIWYNDNLGVKPSILVLNSPVFDFGIVNETVSGRDNYFQNKYHISDSSRIFLYLGILGLGRGIELCLDVFSRIEEDVHVVFMGSGDLEGLIKKYSIDFSNIHFHSPVNHNEVVSLASSADFGLCLIENASLSDYLCLPNKLFEYSFAGLRILASDFPEISKVVVDYDLGICCDLDFDSVRSSIISLLNTQPINNASDIANLSWAVQAKRLCDAYRSLFLIHDSRQKN